MWYNMFRTRGGCNLLSHHALSFFTPCSTVLFRSSSIWSKLHKVGKSRDDVPKLSCRIYSLAFNHHFLFARATYTKFKLRQPRLVVTKLSQSTAEKWYQILQHCFNLTSATQFSSFPGWNDWIWKDLVQHKKFHSFCPYSQNKLVYSWHWHNSWGHNFY